MATQTDATGATQDTVLEAIVSSMGEGVYAIDGEGLVTFLNPAAEAMLGWKQPELLGREVHEAIHFQRADGTRVPAEECPLLEVVRSGVAYRNDDDVFTRKDGTLLPVAYVSSPIVSDGRTEGAVVAFRDISERKRAEEELRRSRDQLQIILQGVTDGITVQDTTGEMIYANDAAARATGYSSIQELLQTPVSEVLRKFEIVDERGEPFALDQLPSRLALEGVQPQETILGFRSLPDGEQRWSVVRATPVSDERGRVQFTVSLFHDITERKRAEDAQRFLAQASEVLSSSLDYETTLRSVAQLAVPHMADWCSVDIIDEEEHIRKLGVAHVDPRKAEMARELQARYPADPNSPRGVPNVLRTGQPEFYPEISDAVLVAVARDPEHLRILREVGMRSGMIVPLVARGRVLGAISFVSAESGRRYDRADLALAEDLGRRAAVAIDNARQYRERSRAEEAISESEERFRLMADTAPALIWMAGADGLCTYFNKPWLDFTGRALGQEMGNGWVEGVHPDDVQRCLDIYLSSLEARESFTMEYRLRRHDGEYRWLIDSGVPRFTTTGRFTGYIGSCIDITERKHAEEALRASEARFRTVVEQSPLSMQFFSPDGWTLQVNRAWEKLWGVTLDQIGGYNVLQDPQLVEKGIMPYIEQGFAGQATEIPPVRYEPDATIPNVSDVGYRWVKAFIYPVKDSAGKVQEVVLIHEDVTDRERAQEELRRSQASLAHAQRIARVGSWEWDVSTGEDRWSDEVFRIFGFAPQEFVPTYETFLSCVHPDDRDYVVASVTEALARRKTYDTEHRILHPDGTERIIHEQAEVVFDAAGKPIRMVGTVQDVTERRRTEEQKSALLAQVQQALELRNQFLSIASHELKTPVTLLKGYTQLLHGQAQTKGDTALLRPLRVIDRQVERMARLIDDLLDVSRIESGRMELDMLPFELGAAVEEATGEVRVSSPNFTLHLDRQAEDVWVHGDRMRVQQVVTNLLMNAVKYSDKRKEADIRIARDGDRAVVSVTDYGIGIPKGQQPDVFGLYFRGANVPASNYGGLGLGLYISKAIVERHGGTIGVVSEEGEGSTFHFSLPILDVEGSR